MSEPDFEIPSDRLPEGFAERVDEEPGVPAPPRPAATVVLLRPGGDGPEVLLLRRNRTVGFVPGAYVFPGGRVDVADGLPEATGRIAGLDARAAAARLRLDDRAAALAYYVASLREAFEETGILVGTGPSGDPIPDAHADPAVREAQDDLHGGRRSFVEVLTALGATLDLGSVEYIAHWITPVAEPRRYDTRFFAAAVPPGANARPDGGEITRAVWLTAHDALRANEAGELPMVFPTIKTLQSFLGHASVEELLASFGRRSVPTILPRLVRTPTGVGIEVPDDDDRA